MIISIDFSINSTAVCLKTEKDLHLFSFIPNYKCDSALFKIHKRISDVVNIISYNKLTSSKDAIEDQSIKLINADSLSSTIISSISPFIKEIPEIRIEGFSFGSKGNSFIDLITYNTFLKVKLIEKWGHCISVISPKTIKKLYSGNGNASKCDMLRSFISKEENFLKEKILELEILKEGDFIIPKPIDDLVDSVALSQINITKGG